MNDKDRPMPPLIAFAGALGGLAVVRWAYKTAVRINRELEEARLARVAEGDSRGSERNRSAFANAAGPTNPFETSCTVHAATQAPHMMQASTL